MWHWLTHGQDQELGRVNARLEVDHKAAKKRQDRATQVAGSLEARIEANHIASAIADLWRQGDRR